MHVYKISGHPHCMQIFPGQEIPFFFKMGNSPNVMEEKYRYFNVFFKETKVQNT